jgi:cell division protein ZapA (FtsZ GTPase activity inhibitor)
MANEQNLRPSEYKLSQEEAKKGGIASGKARREKKTVQKILNDFLETSAKDNPQISKLASKMGLQSGESIKDLFTIVCTLNTLKSGKLSDLETLSKLLGEDKFISQEAKEEDDPLTKALKEEAERINNANIE